MAETGPISYGIRGPNVQEAARRPPPTYANAWTPGSAPAAPKPAEASRDYPPGLIGVPALEMMPAASAEGLVKLFATAPRGCGLHFAYGTASIALKRNVAVSKLLEAPSLRSLRWLLFVDSDMLPSPWDVQRLLAHELPIVSALAHRRMPPYTAVAHPIPGESLRPGPGKRPVEVIGCGGAFLLVRREVFEAIPYPWFEHPEPGSGEDYYFIEKARDHGFRAYVDTAVQVGHVGMHVVTTEMAEAWHAATPGAPDLYASNGAGSRAEGHGRLT